MCCFLLPIYNQARLSDQRHNCKSEIVKSISDILRPIYSACNLKQRNDHEENYAVLFCWYVDQFAGEENGY